jgi:hypothetical protein
MACRSFPEELLKRATYHSSTFEPRKVSTALNDVNRRAWYEGSSSFPVTRGDGIGRAPPRTNPAGTRIEGSACSRVRWPRGACRDSAL